MSYPHGTVLRPAIERFLAKVAIQEGGCWEWTAVTAGEGYGYFYRGSVAPGEHGRIYAHRWSYEYHVGPIPKGLVIDHLCRNRLCVNPEHLEPVSQLENVRRGHGNGKQTHCPAGHEYAGENLYITPKGGRQCRACKRQALRKYREKNIARKAA